MKKAKVVFGTWDWKETPYEDLKGILKKYGVHMYQDPMTEGSDCYGFIFSDKPLTKKEIEQLSTDEWS